MAILIDGYNLLNAASTEGVGGGTELERARRGLLEFLASLLSESELTDTTIVFDAGDAPPGLPRQEQHAGIVVLYSKGYREADDLIEELIAADHSPRQLLVVSSDHRLHRAARRRRATAIDSDVWLAKLAGRSTKRGPSSAPQKPSPNSTQAADWLEEFADIDVAAIQSELEDQANLPAERSTASEGPAPVNPPAKKMKRPHKEGLRDEDLDALANPFPADFAAELESEFEPLDPFPPGYAEDVTDEDPLP